MTKNNDLEIGKDELDWSRAEVQEGRPHGVVVSVRLDAHEAGRLRELASTLGLNMSQVSRQAEDVPFAVELRDGGPGVMVRRGSA